MRKRQPSPPAALPLPPRWKVAVWMKLKDPEGVQLFDSLLRSLGLSRLRLAQSIGKSHTTINNIRNGEGCRPDTADDIAEVLGVPTDLLFLRLSSRQPDYTPRPNGRKAA